MRCLNRWLLISLVACSVGVDTILTLHHTTRFAATRPFLKWFSTYFSACFRHFWTEIIGRSLIGSLSLAIQEFHGLSDTDLGSVVGDEHRILLLQNLEDFGYGHPSSFFLILGRTEAGFQHAFYVIWFKEGIVALLDAGHLFVAEPVGHLLLGQFIDNLGVQLLIIDRRTVIDVFACRNSDADEAAASRRVAERMLIVGGSQERSIAQLCR